MKVFGIWPGWFWKKRRLLGYLPAQTAAYIADGGQSGKILPRLRNIYLNDGGYVVIRIDVLEPRTSKPEKKPKPERKPRKPLQP